MTGPEISVALCTHNGAEFVREQVESILKQTVPPTQLVLSDDASTDNTVAIVEAAVGGWPEPRPELVVIRNPSPLGVVANFEQAVTRCTGDLIALCDQDDIWMPDKLMRFVALFAAERDLPLAHSDATLVSAEGDPLPHPLLGSLEATPAERERLTNGRSFDALIRRNLVTGATVVFRRTLLDRALPFPRSWVHDEWLAIIAAAVSRTLLIDERLIDYRQHGGNQIGASKPGLADKLGKLREPRSVRNRRLVARSVDVVDRLELLGAAVDPARLTLARAKLAHERWRLALPANPVLRAPRIVGAVLAGRYGRFSRGIRDAARDLVQPAG
ncbi:MAG: glycosyltransferase family 2 protein [Rhodoglobus sp.]